MAKAPQVVIEDKIYEVAVVGGGSAGLYQSSLSASKGEDTVLLEASEAVGGTAKSGFSLLDASESASFPVLTGSILDPLVVRWERQWVDPSAVDWQSTEWEMSLPQ